MEPFSDVRAETVAAWGERRLIRALREWLGDVCPPAPMGIGDDCAVLPPGGGGPSGWAGLATVDSVVYGRHFDASVPAAGAGAKLLKRNLSDIAAMGGVPGPAVVALFLPRRTRLDWLEAFYGGLAECARAHGVAVVGGDTTETEASLAANLTLWGWAERPLRRTGARVGDTLWVTGTLGGSLAGRHWRFEPRLREGRWLAGLEEVRAALDVTDGLAKDLLELLPAGAAAALDRAALPVDPAVAPGTDRLRAALCDGEDYELAFAVDGGADADGFAAAFHGAFPGTRLTRIGRIVTAGALGEPLLDPAGAPLRDGAGRPLSGYEHLG